jgi:YegS/Rv2252/BmrU family lipid kinase
VFAETGIEWDAFVTKKAGDAQLYAHEAAEAGIDALAVYGGDGTVLEAASGLRGTQVPLAILPGGTANVISQELGIPRDLADAARLLARPDTELRAVDMGEVGGELFFHLGLGIEGEMIKGADRAAKDSSGTLAYIRSALRSVRDVAPVHYRLLLDGKESVEIEGVNLMVTNFGSVGVAGLKLSHAVDMSDGLMDVIVIQSANLGTFLSAAQDAVASGEIARSLLHWQVREVEIITDQPQTITRDGELMEITDIKARVVPAAVRIIVPRAASE